MNQQEFYSLPEVIEQIDIMKSNPHGSATHREAYAELYNIAAEHGAEEDFAPLGREVRMEQY